MNIPVDPEQKQLPCGEREGEEMGFGWGGGGGSQHFLYLYSDESCAMIER